MGTPEYKGATSPIPMPFKSKAQRRKFAQLLVDGKITPEVFEEWNRETGGQHLPERVDTRKKKTRRRKPVARRKRKAPTRRSARTRARSRTSKVKSSRKRARRG